VARNKILFITSQNFFKLQHGMDARFYELAKYLVNRGYILDIFSPENYGNGWKTIKNYNKKWIDRICINDSIDTGYRFKIFFKRKFPFLVKWKYKIYLYFELQKRNLNFSRKIPDLVNDSLINKFDSFLKTEKYEFIIFSYIFWARLIADNKYSNINKIILIEDIVTHNIFGRDNTKPIDRKLLAEEISRMDLFDTAICISEYEMQILSECNIKPNLFHIPFFMEQKERSFNHQYDILFIGSNNIHNIKGINWFFSNVYPLLNDKLQILIVGLIAHHVPQKNNVTKITFGEDLDKIYSDCKLSISPLISGTGQKIKVVEALAYGKPVICTSKGAEGISGNDNGCLITDSPLEFASLIHRLIYDKEFFMKNSNKAHIFFSSHYKKDVIYNKLDRIFKFT
jgi:glycosyltransferase involved in cell wall biosynthesis